MKQHENSDEQILCHICGLFITREDNFERHLMSHSDENTDHDDGYDTSANLLCQICGAQYKDIDNLIAHLKTHSRKRSADQTDPEHVKLCNYCKIIPPANGYRYCKPCGQGKLECKGCKLPRRPDEFENIVCVKCRTCMKKAHNKRGGALGGAANTVPLTYKNKLDLLMTLKEVESEVEEILRDEIEEKNGLKWQMKTTVEFMKITPTGEETITQAVFQSDMQSILKGDDTDEQVDLAYQDIHEKMANYTKEGSGWTLSRVLSAELKYLEYQPIAGSSYVPLPPCLAKRRGIVNPQNENDSKCLVWATLIGLKGDTINHNPRRIAHYTQYEDIVNVKDIDFPTPITQMKKFENQNEFSVNLFAFESDTENGKPEVFPVYITKKHGCDQHINLLVIRSGDKCHYTYIKSLSRLLNEQKRDLRKKFYCDYCLHGFLSHSGMEEHKPLCSRKGPQKTKFPEPGKCTLTFTDFHKALPCPFIIYCDTESILEPIDDEPEPSTTKTFQQANPSMSSTRAFQAHRPCAYAFKTVCTADPSLSRPVEVYRGPDVIPNMIEALQDELAYIKSITDYIEPIRMTAQDWHTHLSATHCHICSKPFDDAFRVKNHHHITGEYLGPAHNTCNRSYRFPEKVVCVFHNLKNYDQNHILSYLKDLGNAKITCIAQNSEKYVTFSIGNLCFIDSLQFMSCSLEKLVQNLAAEGDRHFHYLKQEMKESTPLLLRKGVFCYQFLDSEAAFDYPGLPGKDKFYNQLTEEPISDDDYAHAQAVWDHFGFETFGQYHDLYLKTDVLLLSDLFERFRTVLLSTHGLDAAHFCTLASYSFACMMNYTKVQLELLTDPDMYLMIENAKRGGISSITRKFSKANNPFLKETYQKDQPQNTIMYWDCNNLYGTVMVDKLPTDGFKFLTPDEVDQFDVMTIPDDSGVGYFLEVDLDYPEHLHDAHNDFPLAAERLVIKHEMLSPYSKALADKLGLKGPVTAKLAPNFYHKRKYCLHYRNLKFYLQEGLVLVKVHRIVSFNQSAWLAPYIELNTELRKNATDDFSKEMFKLMNNAVYGKTLENVRKRTNVILLNNADKLSFYTAKPNLRSFKIFHEYLVGVECSRVTVLLNKPIYIGVAVLDLSKLVMLKLYYSFLQHTYPGKIDLLATDTDSFILSCKDVNPYCLMAENPQYFDTSNYPRDHPLYSDVNARKLGLLKDEMKGAPIKEYIGLKPKMYSLLCSDDSEKKTAKGIKHCVTRNVLRHEDYKSTLFDEQVCYSSMNTIRSIDHRLKTFNITKLSLTSIDQKRWVMDDKITTLAFGHYATCE